MAYVNVAEWNSDQVAEWLKGLDDVLLPYIHSFVNKNVDGQRLLHLAHDDFPSLNISCIGHQEIILQGVELLNNIHYHIHKENLQDIALRLSSKARSIYNELCISESFNQDKDKSSWESVNGFEQLNGHDGFHSRQKKERVSTRIVAGVADVLSSVKTLVSWLHRTPFHGQEQYDELKSNLVDISIGLATMAQRDSFAENPVSVIRDSCLKLAEIADSIIQDSKDPLILQPASLDVFTIKKRADDNWGIGLFSSYHGIHQISAIRSLSPAHTCGKLMGGDQVVQVNYQTVVGWMSYKVTQLMQENPTQVILTLKKCPRHVNTITEIYFKPIRLPSKKRTYSPWNSNVMIPQPYDLQSIPNLQFIKSFDGRSAAQRVINTEPHPKSMTPTSGGSNSVNATLNSSGSEIGATTASEGDDEASDFEDDAFMSDDTEFGGSSSLSVRLFQPKPRPHVQRRATIPGATARHSLPFDHILQEYCQRQILVSPVGNAIEHDSYLFRNKDNLESRVIRPHTCIGTEKKEGKKQTTFPSIKDEGDMPFIDESDEKEDADDSFPSIILSQSKISPAVSPKKERNNEADALLWTFPDKNRTSPLKKRSMTPPKSPIEAIDELKIFRRTSEERPKLDKSYSSPTYDLDDSECSAFLERKNRLISCVKESNSVPETPAGKESRVIIGDSECRTKEEEAKDSVTLLCKSDSAEMGSCHELPYSANFETTITEEPQNFTDSTSQNILSSLALPTLEIMSSSVPSISTNLGGKRRISCRDLGQGDHHGWLYRRKESKGFLLSHRWEKRWFILKKSNLYGYRDKDAMKADSLIYLPGFHVCPAPDVKSKRFAFKIYHSSGATFYFACDTGEERSRWMSQMGLSAISSSAIKCLDDDGKNEEAYYSETDDELDKSPKLQRSPYSPPSRISPGREVGLPLGKQTTPSPSSRISPLGSLGGVRSPGLKFLQSSKTALSQPLPTSNFRSYVRVRDSPSVKSSSTNNLLIKEGSSHDTSAVDTKERKQVFRKGSLRERLKQLPASLTLDRRKIPKCNSTSDTSASPSRMVVGSKSETSLPEKFIPSKDLQNKSNSQLPGHMKHTHSSIFMTPTRPSAEMELFPQSKFARFSPSNASENPFNFSPEDMHRRGSVSGISNSSYRSASPRRGSLDCLLMKGTTPPSTPVKIGDGSLGSNGSLSTNEYIEGSPEKLWIQSLRSNAPKSRSGICIKVPLGMESIPSERLKRTVNYQPPMLRNKPETMQTAFEMNLSASCISQHSNGKNFLKSQRVAYNTPASKNLISPQESPNHRPQVPPRTKFLSPKERHVSVTSASSLTPSPTATTVSSEIVSRVRSKAPPNLTISPSSDDAEAPRTPLKPTMGVSMIGKQRRTPGVLSPREVFVFSPHSPYHSPSPSNRPLPRSHSSGYILTNKVDQILPHYPGMEYPPTFEPESYSLSLTPEDRPPSISPHPALPPKPQREVRSSFSSPSTSSPSSTIQTTAGYVNISHVSNTLAEFQGRSYHHNIYVTSPCSGGVSQSSNTFSSLQSPYQSNEGVDNNQTLLDEYVPMGQVTTTPQYINTSSLCRTRIWEENEDNLSQGD